MCVHAFMHAYLTLVICQHLAQTELSFILVLILWVKELGEESGKLIRENIFIHTCYCATHIQNTL